MASWWEDYKKRKGLSSGGSESRTGKTYSERITTDEHRQAAKSSTWWEDYKKKNDLERKAAADRQRAAQSASRLKYRSERSQRIESANRQLEQNRNRDAAEDEIRRLTRNPFSSDAEWEAGVLQRNAERYKRDLPLYQQAMQNSSTWGEYFSAHRQAGEAQSAVKHQFERYQQATQKAEQDRNENNLVNRPALYASEHMTPEQISAELDRLRSGAATPTVTDKDRNDPVYAYMYPDAVLRKDPHGARFDERLVEDAGQDAIDALYRPILTEQEKAAVEEADRQIIEDKANRNYERVQILKAAQSMQTERTSRETGNKLMEEIATGGAAAKQVESGRAAFEAKQQQIASETSFEIGDDLDSNRGAYNKMQKERRERGYIMGADWDTVPEARKQAVYALYAQDPEKAMELAKYYIADARQAEDEERQAWYAQSGWTAALGLVSSAAAHLGAAVDPFGDVGQELTRYGDNALAGGSQWADAATGYQKIPEWVPIVGGKGAGDFYQTVGSVVQSAAVAAPAILAGRYDTAAAETIGKLGLALMGSSAAASDYRESVAAGMDEDRAKLHALAAGVEEALFEEISLDKLIKMDTSGGLKSALKNWLVQSGIEGSEELATSIANRITDEMISGAGQSKVERRASELIANGMNSTQAHTQAESEWMTDTLYEGFSGFLSGGMMTGGNYALQGAANLTERAVNAVETRKAQRQAGAAVSRSEGSVEALQAYAKDNGIEIKAVETAEQNAEENAEQGEQGATKNSYSSRDYRSISDTNSKVVQSIRNEVRGKTVQEQQAVRDSLVEKYGEGIAPVVNNAISVETAARVRQEYGSVDSIQAARNQAVSEIKDQSLRRAVSDGYDSAAYSLAASQGGEGGMNTMSRYIQQRNNTGTGEMSMNATVTAQDGSTKTISITGMSEDGKRVSLADGSEVAVKDLQADADTTSAIQQLADLDLGDDATKVLQAYQQSGVSGTEGYRWLMDYATAYNQGRTRQISLEQAAQRSSLDERTVMDAYTLGQQAANRETLAGLEKLKNLPKRKGASGRSANIDTTEIKGKTMSKSELEQFEIANQYAQALGVDMTWFSSKEKDGKFIGKNGAYENGKIYMDIHAGRNFAADLTSGILATMGHELTHFQQQYAPEEYQAIKEFLFEQIVKSSPNGEARLERLIWEKQRRSGYTLSRKAAEDEVVADACQKMLRDSKAVHDFASQQPEAANGVVRWLDKWFKRVRSVFKRGGNYSEEAQLMDSLEQDVKAAFGELWDKALKQAAKVHDEVGNIGASAIRGIEETGASEQMAEEAVVQNSDRLDDETLRFLDEQEHVTVYRAMQMIDGKLYPPMAAKVEGKLVDATELGEWYQAVERPDLIDPKTGKWKLDKANGKAIKAAYNPYFHTSATPLNDQFSSAYKRPNIVVVEGIIPKSELTSGYKAQYAKDSVGETKWHAGPVASKLKGAKSRRVFLSRWFQAQRVVSDAEVADVVAKTLEGENIAVPNNVVTPSLLEALRERGVAIDEGAIDRFESKHGMRQNSERDTEYLELAKDPEKNAARLQEMVDEAAKKAGYTIKAYHAGAKNITAFQSGNSAGLIYFADTEKAAKQAARSSKQVYTVYLKADNPVNSKNTPVNWYDAEDSLKVAKWKREGYDAVYVKDEAGVSIAVFAPEQIKSADPVTYDDDGNVIPLSERFNEANQDIRYSERDNAKPRSAQAQRDAGYKLSESKFYSLYSAHKLNMIGKGNVQEQISSIMADGFKGDGGFGNNVMPTNISYDVDENGKRIPRGLSAQKYAPKKGEYILLVPKEGVEVKGGRYNFTERVKPGYKPAFDYEIVQADYDGQPYYEMYEKAYDKSQAEKADVTLDGAQFSERDYFDGMSEEQVQEELTRLQQEKATAREKQRSLEKTDEYKRLFQDVLDTRSPEAISAFNKWADESGYVAAVDRAKEVDARRSEGAKVLDRLIDQRLEREEREAIQKSGKSEAEYFAAQAVKNFGYTPYFYDAGYIVPNGKMLNFSGQKGRHFGSRGQDHRAIGQIYAATNGSAAMNRFMNQGNVRIMAESPGIDISSATPLTKEQYATIRRFVNEVRSDEYFNLDFSDERGNNIGSIEYEGRFTADRVLNDIRHFFDTGEVRQPSGLSAFYSERDYSTPSDEELLMNAKVEDADNADQGRLLKDYQALGKRIATLEKQLAEARRQTQLTNRALNTRGIGNVVKTVMKDYDITDARHNGTAKNATLALTDGYQKALDLLDKGASPAEVNDAVYNGAVKAAEIILEQGTYSQNLGGKWQVYSASRYLGESRQELIDSFVSEAYADFVSNRYREARPETAADRLVARTKKEAQERVNKYKGRNDALAEANRRLEEKTTQAETEAKEARKAAGELFLEIKDLRQELMDNKTMSEQERKAASKKLKALNKSLEAKREEAANWQKRAKRNASLLKSALESKNRDISALNNRLSKEQAAALEKQKSLEAKLEKQIQRERDILAGKLRAPELVKLLKAEREKAEARVKKQKEQVFQNYKDRKNRTAIRNRIKNLHAEMSRDLLRPREGHFVPEKLIRPVVDLLDLVNTETNRAKSESAQARIAAINAAYDAIKKDERYSQFYDETVKDMLVELSGTMAGRSIYDLTTAELEDVYTVMKAMRTTIRNAIKADLIEKGKEIWEIGNEMRQELRAGRGAHALQLLEKYHMTMLSAKRAFNRFGGYQQSSAWNKVYRMLDDAQLKMLTLEMQGTRIFDRVLEGKENLEKAEKLTSYREDDLVDVGLKDETGKAVPIPRGMMLSLYMHLQNEENMRHLMYGGITLPDFKRYYKGRSEAWGQGTVSIPALGAMVAPLDELFSKGELSDAEYEEAYKEHKAEIDEIFDSIRKAIEEQLTDYDRQWIAASREFFDGFSRRELNRVTNEMYGFSKAKVNNYFPIVTDSDFLKSEFESISKNISLENAGFMKERVRASNPILLEDITKAVNRQISNVSRYAGLTQALKTFGNVYNVQDRGFTDSVKKAMAKTYGKNGQQYVENLITDMVGGRNTPGTIFDRVKGNYAQAVLAANLSVTIKQAASFPTAAATVGWGPLMKAMARGGKSNLPISRADSNLISIYSPLLWYRSKGAIDVEIGDIANGRDWTQKAKWLMGWIEKTDRATVGRLWYAAEYYVKDNYNLEKGTEEQIKNGESPFYRKVAEVFADIVEDTQPNYTILQRPDILRNPNKLVRAMVMFSTQRFQNGNILIDAIGEYRAMVRADKQNGTPQTKTARKAARQKLTRAISSQTVSAMVLSAMTLLAGAVMHRMNPWRDDDDELTFESIAEEYLNGFLSSLAGSFLAGSEVYEGLQAMLTGSKYYGNDVGGISAINELATSVIQFEQQAVKLIGDEDSTAKDWQNLAEKQLWKVGEYLSQMTGIPTANIKKIIEGGRNHIADIMNEEFFSFEAGVDRSTAVNARRYMKAIQAGDTEKAEAVMEEMRENYKEEKPGLSEKAITKKVRNSLSSYIKEQYTSKEISEEDAISYLVDYTGKKENDAFWQIREWEAKKAHKGDAEYTFSPYEHLRELIDNGKDLTSEIAYLQEHGKTTSAINSDVKKYIKKQFDGGELNEQEAMKMLQKYHKVKDDRTGKYRNDTEDEAWFILDEWKAGIESEDDEEFSYEKYRKLYSAMDNDDDASAAWEEMSEHGVSDDTLKKAVSAHLQKQFQAGEISEDVAIDRLQSYRGMDEDEAYWQVDKWKSSDAAYKAGEDFNESNYRDLYAAIDGNKDPAAAMKELTSHGYKESDVYTQAKKYLSEKLEKGEITEQAFKNKLSRYCKIVKADEVDDAVQSVKNSVRYKKLMESKPNLDATESQVNAWYDGTANTRNNGHESAKTAGMSIENYIKAKTILADVKDANGNRTGEDEYIAALTKITWLTPRQKDALYYERYKGTTKYSHKTW